MVLCENQHVAEDWYHMLYGAICITACKSYRSTGILNSRSDNIRSYHPIIS